MNIRGKETFRLELQSIYTMGENGSSADTALVWADKKIKELEAENTALEAENAKLKARVEELREALTIIRDGEAFLGTGDCMTAAGDLLPERIKVALHEPSHE